MLSGNTPCINDLFQISDDIGLAIYDTMFYYFHINTVKVAWCFTFARINRCKNALLKSNGRARIED